MRVKSLFWINDIAEVDRCHKSLMRRSKYAPPGTKSSTKASLSTGARRGVDR
jgi:hypothetical protein